MFLLNEEVKDDGKTKEIEYRFFAILNDFTQLEKADKKYRMEQWSIRTDMGTKMNDGSGRSLFGDIRVRAYDNRRFVFTVKSNDVKLKKEHLITNQETEKSINREMFDQLKSLSPQGMIKTRYIFNIPNTELKWEVDVFETNDGDISSWIRIELEVPEKLDKVPEFPLDVTEFTENNTDRRKKYIAAKLRNTIMKRKDSILPVER